MCHASGELSDAFEALRRGQLLLATATLGHVHHHALQVTGFAVLAVEGRALLLDPDPRPVGPPHAVRAREAAPFAKAGLRLTRRMLHVLWVEPRQPKAGLVGPLVRFEARESFDLGTDVDDRRVLVEACEIRDRGDLLDQRAPAVLGRTPRLLGLLALGYVAEITREEGSLTQYGADGHLDRELSPVAA